MQESQELHDKMEHENGHNEPLKNGSEDTTASLSNNAIPPLPIYKTRQANNEPIPNIPPPPISDTEIKLDTNTIDDNIAQNAILPEPINPNNEPPTETNGVPPKRTPPPRPPRPKIDINTNDNHVDHLTNNDQPVSSNPVAVGEDQAQSQVEYLQEIMIANSDPAQIENGMPIALPEKNGNNSVEVVDNPMGAIIRHRINQESEFKLRVIGEYLAEIAVAGCTLLLYWKPAKDFAGDDTVNIIVFEGSVMAANFGLSLYAASEVYKSLFKKRLPDDIALAINQDLNKGRGLKAGRHITAVVLGALAAIPYSMATVGIVPKILVGISNAILNYYGINNLLFEHGISIYRSLVSAPEKRAYYTLLDAFNHSVNSVIVKMVEQAKENIPLPDGFKKGSTLNRLQLLELLAQKAGEDGGIEAQRPLAAWEYILRKVAPGAFGSGLVLLGLSVYVLKTYENIHDLSGADDIVNMPFTGVISLPFLYLAATFGAKTFIDFVSLFYGNRSLAFRLYPVQTILVMIGLAAVVAGSFATIVGLVLNDPNFGEGGQWAAERDYVVVLAAIAAVLFNNYANQKLGFKIIEAIACRWGSKQEIAKMAVMAREFLEDVNSSMSRQKFVDSLFALNKEDRKALLPMVGVRDNVDRLLETARGNSESGSYISLFKNLSRQTLAYLRNAQEDELDELLKLPPNQRKQHVVKQYGSGINTEIEEVDRSPGCWEKAKSYLPSCPTFGLSLRNPFRRANYTDIDEIVRNDDVENRRNDDPENPPIDQANDSFPHSP